jgi:preprotein translocase subunit SecD
LPEREKPTFVERVIQLALKRTLSSVVESVERFVKRALRTVVMALAGITIAVLGIAFLAVGAVKWFSILMPNWLAWSIVGIILLLIGVVLGLATLVSSRG